MPQIRSVNNKGKVHFVAIGGSVMHSLAISLHQLGYQVSGSDDHIYEPSKSNLEKYGLLPKQLGWNESLITNELDAVILGMHARPDNPELLKAKSLGLPIKSFPEFIQERSHNKQRVVISGSHGKTTITAIIIHVLKYWKKQFDYMIGAPVPGFENQVQITDAPVIIIEGDEYYSSPEDKTPKFLKYQHHILLISGIAWDHINAYPNLEAYAHQFDILGDNTPKAGTLIYCGDDSLASMIGSKERADVKLVEYNTPKYEIIDGKFCLFDDQNIPVPVNLIGKHNMQNIQGAVHVLSQLGITKTMFVEAIQTFDGAWKRLQPMAESSSNVVYSDYAHAPSKVAATLDSLREFHPRKSLISCLELHTYSSLNKEFLSQYHGKFYEADVVLIYYNPKALALKGMDPLDEDTIKSLIGVAAAKIFSDKELLSKEILNLKGSRNTLLMMSSGNFDGLDISTLAKQFV